MEIENLFQNNSVENALEHLCSLNLEFNFQISPKTGRSYLHIDYGIFSPKDSNLVKECRGIALDTDSWKVVRYGFYRFMNHGETGQDIFEKNAPIAFEEKADGSIIIVWYSEEEDWVVGTRGRIFSDVKIQNFDKTFGELFSDLFQKFDKLDKSVNYIFELCSPMNRVVVYYKPHVVLIGARDTNNWFEIQDENLNAIAKDLDVRRPEVFKFKNIDEAVKYSKTLPGTQEGFVAKQWDSTIGRYKRIKIKGDSYKDLHMTFSAKSINNLVRLVIRNDRSYFELFPEYLETFDLLRGIFDRYIEDANKTWEENKDILFNPSLNIPEKERRKLFVQAVMKTPFGNYCFQRADGKISDMQDVLAEDLKVKSRTKKYINLFNLKKIVGDAWQADIPEEDP